MSFEAAAWAIKQKTKTATDKLVLIVLADCHNLDSNACFPSYPYIAKHAQCCERQVQRSILSLEKDGLIFVQRAAGKSHNYLLQISTLDNLSPLTNDTKPQTFDTKPQTSCPDTLDTMSTKPGSNQEVISNKPRKRSTKKTKLPTDFQLSAELATKATIYWQDKQREDLCHRVQEIFDQFLTHHIQHGKTMACWNSAWKTWYTNAVKFERKPHDFIDYDKQKRDAREEYIRDRFDPLKDF